MSASTTSRQQGASSFMAVAAGILLTQGAASNAQAPRLDPWGSPEFGYERGFQRAEEVIGQCLERVASTPDAKSDDCIQAVFRTCEREHGTMSQRDLNDCAAFSRKAWEKRLDAVRSRLFSAATIDPERPAEPMVERLRESDRRWREWSEADCELQAHRSSGGSMHQLELFICHSNHAAHRAIELEALVVWWDRVFKL